MTHQISMRCLLSNKQCKKLNSYAEKRVNLRQRKLTLALAVLRKVMLTWSICTLHSRTLGNQQVYPTEIEILLLFTLTATCINVQRAKVSGTSTAGRPQSTWRQRNLGPVHGPSGRHYLHSPFDRQQVQSGAISKSYTPTPSGFIRNVVIRWGFRVPTLEGFVHSLPTPLSPEQHGQDNEPPPVHVKRPWTLLDQAMQTPTGLQTRTSNYRSASKLAPYGSNHDICCPKYLLDSISTRVL